MKTSLLEMSLTFHSSAQELFCCSQFPLSPELGQQPLVNIFQFVAENFFRNFEEISQIFMKILLNFFKLVVENLLLNDYEILTKFKEKSGRNIHQCQPLLKIKTQEKLQHFHTKLRDHDWSWCCEDAGVSLCRLIVPIIKI